MKIYLYLDNEDPEDLAEPVAEAIRQWLEGDGVNSKWVRLVNQPSGFEDDPRQTRVGSWDLGLVMETNKKIYLKEPLNFLNSLAKEHEQEFVVGYFDDETGEPESVCYFGFEEGRPDLFEIANYLGLEK